MSRKRFEVTILTEFCKGCGLCVEFCEQGKLYIEPRPDRRGVLVAAARPEVDCTGCRNCATMCPDAAIRIVSLRPAVSAGSAAGGDRE